MDSDEARKLLGDEIEKYTAMSYDAAKSLIGIRERRQLHSRSGTLYQVTIEIVWDWKPGGDIRVSGHIDDATLFRAMVPMNESWIIEKPSQMSE